MPSLSITFEYDVGFKYFPSFAIAPNAAVRVMGDRPFVIPPSARLDAFSSFTFGFSAAVTNESRSGCSVSIMPSFSRYGMTLFVPIEFKTLTALTFIDCSTAYLKL